MDGLEATRIIRKMNSPIAKVPILALTAHSTLEDHQKCLSAGMNDFITKPVKLNQLLERILQWL